ncbi:MAG: hypothetical protein Q4G49_13710 [Paracoccus sp. (in: a-proteobacteria)]|nr:hypothetical protein [Paracoccus sp. (in: a-proteobacteria)]
MLQGLCGTVSGREAGVVWPAAEGEDTARLDDDAEGGACRLTAAAGGVEVFHLFPRSLSLKGSLPVSPSREYPQNSHDIVRDMKCDRQAPLETDDPKIWPDIAAQMPLSEPRRKPWQKVSIRSK